MCNMNIKCVILLLIFTVASCNKVESKLDTTWWKHSILYQVYTSSFKDSNGDGIGDIKGISQKLDHLVDLGIDSLYLSPFYKSPMADFGYDISNYTEIDPRFGTISDFDELIREMKHRGLKLVVDFVINHSSEEHPWFQKSIDRIDPYTNFYVWKDPKGFDQNGNPIPPNNWWSVFDISAWTWNEKRQQFYLHQFSTAQPDFNLRNAELMKEVKKIMKFWMDRGVAGFRLDAARHYIEDEFFRDEFLILGKTTLKTYYDLDHRYTCDLWETYEVTHELKDFTDQYDRREGNAYETILIAEAYATISQMMAYYGSENYRITNYPYNFRLLRGLEHYLNASAFDNMLTGWLSNMPKGATANWVAENHDNIRIGSVLGEEYMDIVTITIMTLPGVACIYYGQEIGLTNGIVRADQRQDPNNNGFGPDSVRDGQRLPMQWDNTMNAGFSSHLKPWLPVNSNYWKVNVETQKKDKTSRYNLFKTLSMIRKKNTMKFGSFEPYIVSDWVYAFVRSLLGHEKYITVLNLGSETEHIDLHTAIPHLPSKVEVIAASINAGYKKGDQIRNIPKFPITFMMRPLSAVVLSTKVHYNTP